MANGEVPRVKVFDNTFENLHIAMSNATKRQAILAHNIANMDTPGFEPLEFDEVLGKAVKRAEGKPIVLEDELAALAENNIKYSAYIKFLSSKLNVMRMVASQGRK